MRVQVWLDSDGVRVRGNYHAVPWNGVLEGRITGRDAMTVTLFERGDTREVGARRRQAILHWDNGGSVLSGIASDGTRVELLRAGFAPPELRPGLWLSRWTGLPFEMAVETRIVRGIDGHFRAVYQYQGLGGVRDGSFDGVLDTAAGTLTISWTEISKGTPAVGGQGRFAPSPFGWRGTFGIEGSSEGTGEWTLEPLGP